MLAHSIAYCERVIARGDSTNTITSLAGGEWLRRGAGSSLREGTQWRKPDIARAIKSQQTWYTDKRAESRLRWKLFIAPCYMYTCTRQCKTLFNSKYLFPELHLELLASKTDNARFRRMCRTFFCFALSTMVRSRLMGRSLVMGRLRCGSLLCNPLSAGAFFSTLSCCLVVWPDTIPAFGGGLHRLLTCGSLAWCRFWSPWSRFSKT